MTLVRERRQHKALSLILPSTSANSWQNHNFLSPSAPLSSSSSSTSSNNSSPSIDNSNDNCLSNLEKLDVIGLGNSGTVYKVRHKKNGEIYALKVLRFRENKEGLQQQALREAEFLRRVVDSRFVVMCHGVFENGGFEESDGSSSGDVCFLLEYMERGSLHDLLRKRQKLPEDYVSIIARSVLQGLQYLHGMQIVHRDIKPSNLLINSKGEVKIADFGVSKVANNNNKEYLNNSYMGTCAYMSPERIDPEKWDGNSCYGYEGDVWSIGVVVMECCMGRFPLISEDEKPDWVTLMCSICFEEKKLEMPETDASIELRNFVGRCLVRDWRERATVEELLSHPFLIKFQNHSLPSFFTYVSNYS